MGFIDQGHDVYASKFVQYYHWRNRDWEAFRTGLHFITLALNEAGKFAKSGRMEGISMASRTIEVAILHMLQACFLVSNQ